MSPIYPVPRTNCAHAKQVFPCAQLVQITSLNRAHHIIGVRAVRPSQAVESGELTNRAHPPIPPRGVCGQLAGTPEPTARTIAVRVRCARFEEVGSEAIRYSQAGSLRRRPWEQPPIQTDFLRLSGPLAPGPRATTLGRVAAGAESPAPTTRRPSRHTSEPRPTWAKPSPNHRPGARICPDSRLQGGTCP